MGRFVILATALGLGGGLLIAASYRIGLSSVILVFGAVVGLLASTGVALSVGNGTHAWRAAAFRDVLHRHSTEFGATIVDLSTVTFPTVGYTIPASTAVGNVQVIVPAGAVVSVTTYVSSSLVNYFQGPSMSAGFTSALAPALSAWEVRRALHLTFATQVGIGEIEIIRGGAVRTGVN